MQEEHIKEVIAKTGVISKTDSSVLKGVAIILMILQHTFCFTGQIPAGMPIFKTLIDCPNFVFLCGISFTCVAVFLFITGLGLGCSDVRSSSTCFSTIKKHIKNFYKIYLFSLIVGFTLLSFIPQEYAYSELTPLSFLLALTCIDPSSVCAIWWYASLFMVAMLVFYPCFSFLSKTFPKWGTFWILLITVGLYLSYRYIPYQFNLCVIYCPVFAIGYIIGRYNYKVTWLVRVWVDINNNYYCVRLVLGCVILFGSYYFILELNEWSAQKIIITHNIIALLVSPFLIISSLLMFRNIRILETIFSYFGKYSGLMWLNHAFFLYYYMRYEIYSLDNVAFILLAVLGLSLITAIISKFLIERIIAICFIRANNLDSQ